MLTYFVGKDDMLDVGENKTFTCVIVMKLRGSLKKAGHHICMDNYYTTPSLFVNMKLKVLGVCGTVLVDRKCMRLGWKSKAKGKGQTGQVRKGLNKRKNENRKIIEWRTCLAMER